MLHELIETGFCGWFLPFWLIYLAPALTLIGDGAHVMNAILFATLADTVPGNERYVLSTQYSSQLFRTYYLCALPASSLVRIRRRTGADEIQDCRLLTIGSIQFGESPNLTCPGKAGISFDVDIPIGSIHCIALYVLAGLLPYLSSPGKFNENGSTTADFATGQTAGEFGDQSSAGISRRRSRSSSTRQ